MSCLIPQIMLFTENPSPVIKSMFLEREEDDEAGIPLFEEFTDEKQFLPTHFSVNQ